MPPAITSSRPFKPGTTGWTVRDLDDPRIEEKWFRGRYEIVEGVLTIMPPAYFAGGNALFNLIFFIKTYLRGRGLPGRFATELDVVVDEVRVARSDAAMLTPDDEARQAQAAKLEGRPDPRRTRILVPPTLVVESMSPGHEHHDLSTKRKWYAEFGVPNYWILDGFAQTLECLVLDGREYRVDASGRQNDQVRTSIFPGLVISLKDVWES